LTTKFAIKTAEIQKIKKSKQLKKNKKEDSTKKIENHSNQFFHNLNHLKPKNKTSW